MSEEIKNIIKEIKSYENEELCLILLSQKQNKSLIKYITNLQQENKQLEQDLYDALSKIDKAIDFINEWEKYTKEKRPLEVSMLDLLYIKEILGDKENEET